MGPFPGLPAPNLRLFLAGKMEPSSHVWVSKVASQAFEKASGLSPETEFTVTVSLITPGTSTDPQQPTQGPPWEGPNYSEPAGIKAYMPPRAPPPTPQLQRKFISEMPVGSCDPTTPTGR